MKLSYDMYETLHICTRPLSPQPQHHAVKRNMYRGNPDALKGVRYRADTKMSEPVEPDLFFSSVKSQNIEECHANLCSFSCNCGLNLKPDSMFHGRNPLSPRARVVYLCRFDDM